MTEETQVPEEPTTEAPMAEEGQVYEPIPLELQAISPGTLIEVDTIPDDHPDSPYYSQREVPPEQRVWPPV